MSWQLRDLDRLERALHGFAPSPPSERWLGVRAPTRLPRDGRGNPPAPANDPEHPVIFALRRLVYDSGDFVESLAGGAPRHREGHVELAIYAEGADAERLITEVGSQLGAHLGGFADPVMRFKGDLAHPSEEQGEVESGLYLVVWRVPFTADGD